MTAPNPDADPFWSRPDVVQRFAAREPDLRLMAILDTRPASVVLRALDLGCAGGRNAEALARAGADVHALDRSAAMVKRTRSRLASVLGEREADLRVHLGSMDDLGRFPDGRFDLVVALGVYASAGDRRTFDRTLAETARVMASGAQVLVANFSPSSQPEGKPLAPQPHEPDVYLWRGGRRAVLLEPADLDSAFQWHGLEPAEPTVKVKVPMESGFRVTINARYQKD